MNTPPAQFVRIDATVLRRFGTSCLCAAGMTAAAAEQLAGLLVDSELRGVRSHGIRALPGYANVLRQGGVNPRPEIRVLSETDVSVHLDGDGSLGYAPTMQATQLCIAKARARGTAVGAVLGIGHYGSAGHYVRRAMAAGLIGFSVQSACPQYYRSNEGTRAAHYGNPPLCFGLPSRHEPPVVLDGATCILGDDQRGETFEALEHLIPAAFFKSMGYTAVGTTLGGAFAGQGGERARRISERFPRARMGAMVWLLDPALFAPAGHFQTAVDDMVRLAREELIPMPGCAEATLPGAVEHHLQATYEREGIKIATAQLKALARLGAELDVEVPWEGTAPGDAGA